MLSRPQQLLLARAVATSDRGRLLHADNTSGNFASLNEAVASGQAYFVTPRRNLLVIDLDIPPGDTTGRARSFSFLTRKATEAGVGAVVASSGRAGHRHLYLPVEPGRNRAIIRDWCQAHGLDVRDNGIRPPGSPHRSGQTSSELLSPADPATAAQTLTAPPDPEAAARLARSLSPIQLPAKVRAALRHGHAAAGYESPSHARMGLAVAIQARSGPFTLLATLLADVHSPLGETFRRRPARWQGQELARLWQKAGEWLRGRPPTNPVDTQIQRWEDSVSGAVWRGVAGGTDRSVCTVLADVARLAHTTTPAIAIEDIAARAGIAVDTARRSIHRLLDARRIAVAAEHTPVTARVYRLLAGTTRQQPRASFQVDLGCDLGRWRALGKLTLLLRHILSENPGATSQKLAAITGWKPAAVRYHLRKLARAGLAAQKLACWHPVERDTEMAAQLFGVAGMRDRQKLAVLERRQRRREVLARYRTSYSRRRQLALQTRPD